jgi:RNA polymerase sigma-70 factor (ECF subfamily)
MASEERNERLSKITTSWDMLRQALEGSSDAQRSLLERYGDAVKRYLIAALRDRDAADELFQEFALALVRGDFRQLDPKRGRFRDYIKTVLFHLVARHCKKQQRQPQAVSADASEWHDLAAPSEDQDGQFNQSWREALMQRAWDALAREHRTYHAVLHARAAQPQASSDEFAELLSRKLGKPFKPGAFRQALARARALYVDLLVTEVAQSLKRPTPGQLEEELRELGLLDYCRPVLEQPPSGSDA